MEFAYNLPRRYHVVFLFFVNIECLDSLDVEKQRGDCIQSFPSLMSITREIFTSASPKVETTDFSDLKNKIKSFNPLPPDVAIWQHLANISRMAC